MHLNYSIRQDDSNLQSNLTILTLDLIRVNYIIYHNQSG